MFSYRLKYYRHRKLLGLKYKSGKIYIPNKSKNVILNLGIGFQCFSLKDEFKMGEII
jgi:hypothetical protein